MNAPSKVQTHHLSRSAYLYVRQSSMRQVFENVESTQRQYGLKARAVALGWPDDKIIVIDADQGESGASAAGREGFQRLVTDVGMGRAGIVMGLEVSRLARNNADWHRLLEICAISDTLILDEDGVYDPAQFNDQLLLGLKGAMSSAELHVLKARLRGGVINKARRGEFRCPLPTGFVYDELGNVALDPDLQVRDTISYFFETFLRVGSASQVVKAFRSEGVLFPARLHNAKIVFRPLNASTAIRTLYNPRYAGAYAFGRRRCRRSQDGKMVVRKRPDGDWLACFQNAHPGYITWDQYQENLKRLAENGRGYELARASPPREGAALLQGRAVCGRCGRHMRVQYRARRGGLDAWYLCDRMTNRTSAPTCQTVMASPIDMVVGRLIVENMTPAAVELALAVHKEIEARQGEADELRHRAVERAQFESDLAQRRFMQVDPNNRLVADTLEADWNDKLRGLAKAREDFERDRRDHKVSVDAATCARLVAMTSDFRKLWDNPATQSRDRKRMLAHLVEDVTLVRIDGEGVTKSHVRFRGGKTTTLVTPIPKAGPELVKTKATVVELVDRMLDDHVPSEIAELLNAQGVRPGGSARKGRADQVFTAKRVAYIARVYGLRPRYDRLRARGLLTRDELAERLGVHYQTVARWAEHGLVKGYACGAAGYLYEDPGEDAPRKHCSRWDQLADRAARNGKQIQDAQQQLKEV